jgi:hypothetical protein
MEKFIQLATDPDFQPFQWSWPGNHQPMHATMYVNYFISHPLQKLIDLRQDYAH